MTEVTEGSRITLSYYPTKFLSTEDMYNIQRNIWILNGILDLESQIIFVGCKDRSIDFLVPNTDIAQLLHYLIDNMRFSNE